MAELTDAQKVNREVTQKRIATALETLAQNSEAPIGLGMTGATVGQVPVVKTVDANGVPTSYEPGAGGGGGGGLPAGGTDGDVLVKNGATDYAATWTNTPKQMGSLATINPTSAARTTYYIGDLLVYDGKLYVVTAQTISEGTTLIPGDGGNIAETSVAAQLSHPWQRLINDVTTANTLYNKTHTVYYPNNATEILCTLQLNSNGRTIATAYLPLGQISGAAVYVGGSYTVGVGAPSDYVNAVFIHTSPTSIEIAVPATPVALKVRFFAR